MSIVLNAFECCGLVVKRPLVNRSIGGSKSHLNQIMLHLWALLFNLNGSDAVNFKRTWDVYNPSISIIGAKLIDCFIRNIAAIYKPGRDRPCVLIIFVTAS